MSTNDAHDLSGPQLSVSERSHVFLPVIRKMASQIDVQQAPEWALVGTLMADVQLCAPISDIQSLWAASLKRTYVARAHRQLPKLKVE